MLDLVINIEQERIILFLSRTSRDSLVLSIDEDRK